MIGADLARVIRDTHTLAARSPTATAAELAPQLDAISHHIGRLTGLPGRDNAELRLLGKRMDSWLHSIHDPAVIRNRALLLARFQMLAQAAREVDAIEEDRAEAVTESVVASNVVSFPGPLERGLRLAQVQA
jgi:hypothetical protein